MPMYLQSCSTGCGPIASYYDCTQVGNTGTTTCALPSGMQVPANNRNGFNGGKIQMVVYCEWRVDNGCFADV